MILADRDIVEAWRAGTIGIEPLDLDDVQPGSVDVHLAGDFVVQAAEWVGAPVDTAELTGHLTTRLSNQSCLWLPAQTGFALGSTIERVRLPADITCRLEGKSSLARLGLIVHTAGFIDAGFDGQITLELSNLSPWRLKLHAGMPIAQLCFMAMTRPAERPYGSAGLGSKYQGQTGPTPSRLNWSGGRS